MILSLSDLLSAISCLFFFFKNELILMKKAKSSMKLHMKANMIQPGQKTRLLRQVEGSRCAVSICLWNQVSSSALRSSDTFWKRLRMMPGLHHQTEMQTIKILNPYQYFVYITVAILPLGTTDYIQSGL